MESDQKSKKNSAAIYENVEDIIMYFEDQIKPGHKWMKDGNVMMLLNNSKVYVHYDSSCFKKLA